MKLNTGTVMMLGSEGWEPIGDLVEIEFTHIGIDVGTAVQIQAEHWCGEDPDLRPHRSEVVQLGAMRFCSGCGAWLDHPDA